MNRHPTCHEVETSFEFAETRIYGNRSRSIVDHGLSFDEYEIMKSFVTENAELWNN